MAHVPRRVLDSRVCTKIFALQNKDEAEIQLYNFVRDYEMRREVSKRVGPWPISCS